MKPHLTCHMASSLDGRIVPSRWAPTRAYSSALYEQLHDELGGGSWLIGRVTGQEFAKGSSYPAATDVLPREPWLPTQAAAYGIVIDAHGKIVWGRSDMGGDPTVVVLTEQVSDAHLAGLRSDGVGYVFAGKQELDLALALDVLNAQFGIDRLLVEGGGGINGALLRGGLIDEISLLLEPAIDGRAGTPSVFDGAPAVDAPPLTALTLNTHRLFEHGVVWLRYSVNVDPV